MAKFLASVLVVSLIFASPAAANIDPGAMGDAFDGSGPGSLENALKQYERMAIPSGPLPPIKGTPVPGSDWVSHDPDDDLGEDDPAGGDDDRFNDRLQDRAFDQICKAIKLKGKQKISFSEYGGGRVDVKRRLRRYPTGTFAVVDQGKVKIDLVYSERVAEVTDDLGLSFWFGASWEGKSTVVRPLAGKKSCDEIKTLLNIFKFKTVLPLKAKRIQEMEIGEVWKLPVSLNLGFGAAIGMTDEDVPFTLRLSRSKRGAATVSLYRMSEDKIRFRIRIDQAIIVDKAGAVIANIPAIALGLPEVEIIIVNQFIGLIDKQLARELNKFTAARLGLSNQKRDGNQILIEFLLDPRDSGQMDQLVEVLKGNLDTLSMLREMVGSSLKILREEKNARETLAEMTTQHGETLGAESTFAGVDEYERDRGTFRLIIPFIVDYRSSAGDDFDHYVIADDDGTELRVHRRDSRSETAVWDIPFMGQMVKHNEQKTVQVFTFRDQTGEESQPVAVYVHQEGFLRKNSVTARDMVDEADNVMKYVGVAGEGTNSRTRLPVETLLPSDEIYKMTRRRRRGGGTKKRRVSKSYKRGMMSFSLSFGVQAVRDIVFAPADVVLKAYVNTLSGKEARIMMELIRQATIGGDNRLKFSSKKIVKAVGRRAFSSGQSDLENYGDVRSIAAEASNILQDLAYVRAAEDANHSARRFAKVLAGEKHSDLGFDSILKVFVQLVDPLDISGEFYVNIDKDRKGEEDLEARFSLNREMTDGNLVAGMSRTRRRFEPPARLSD